MAMQSKFPHIRLDKRIWDDPVLMDLSPASFKVWVFAIAWSKDQDGRIPDGILTPHGVERVKATEENLKELVERKLFAKLEDGKYEIVKFSQWQVTSKEESEYKGWVEQQREHGKVGAEKRWHKEMPAVEEGFDQAEAFEAAFEAWPPSPDPKFREGRQGARESFCANITSQSEYELFSAALMNRLRMLKAERTPPAEKRRFLGAFKNFCNERWRQFIPNTKPNQQPQSPAPAKPEQEPAPPPVTEKVVEEWEGL